MRAEGPFDVTLTPQTDAHLAAAPMLGRRLIAKTFRGDLEATSVGEMLSAGTAVGGSAGYVAIEQVTGTLAGRRGTFVLQHTATLTRGAPALSIRVVPDSGTGELEGLSGSMTIIIEVGKHSYEFDYTL